MAGTNRYQLALRAFKGIKGIINLEEIKKIIMIKLGSDQRTINGYLKLLQDANIIKAIGETRFKVNELTN